MPKAEPKVLRFKNPHFPVVALSEPIVEPESKKEREEGVRQRLCNELPRNGPGFDSRSVRCKHRASCPSQGTGNGGASSK